jgi:hypothetical protein
MRFQTRAPRRAALVAILLAGAAVAGLALPATAQGPPTERLKLTVVANTRGPLPACDAAGNCGAETVVQHFLYVDNDNALEHLVGGGPTRAGVTNAFVVSRVDETIYVDGVDRFDFVQLPPPGSNFAPWSGHWPVEVTCPDTGPPCDVVGPPTVLPGERAIVLYTGWAHGFDEPDGTYVFKYTVRGSVNGTPVALVGTAPKIVMTR